MENTSTIHWKTGKPKESGKYLISDKHFNVDTDWWLPGKDWDRHYVEDVMAWCKLSDIDGFDYISK